MTTQATLTSPARIPRTDLRPVTPVSPDAKNSTKKAVGEAGARTPYWDNARFVAIGLVIVGHATLKLISASDTAYAVYLFVYVFQVPAFVMISGYFAKSTPPGVPQLKRLFADIIVPYIIFETVWSGIHWALSGKLKIDYSIAWWTLWFLLALAIWRVVLPYLVILRFPLTISLVISVGAGYLASFDDTFSLARAAALLPFFVLGWKLKQWGIADRWLALSNAAVWRWRALSIALFIGLGVTAGVGIAAWRSDLIRRFLLYDETYASFGYHQWWAGALRLGFIALGALFCFALLTLMPRGKTWFSGMGTRTMYIYLLHALVLYPIRQSRLLDHTSSVWLLVGMIVVSFALAAILGLPIVQKIFHPIVEPNLKWFFRRSEPAAPVAPTEQPKPELVSASSGNRDSATILEWHH